MEPNAGIKPKRLDCRTNEGAAIRFVFIAAYLNQIQRTALCKAVHGVQRNVYDHAHRLPAHRSVSAEMLNDDCSGLRSDESVAWWIENETQKVRALFERYLPGLIRRDSANLDARHG